MKAAIRVYVPIIMLLSACSSEQAEDAAVAAAVTQKPERPAANIVMRETTGSGAPQAKFGFNEAMYPSGPLGDGPDAVRARTENAARNAAGAASAAADAAKQLPAAQKAAKIAYAYDFGFRVSAKKMPDLQRSHAALCAKLGSQNCHVLQMNQSGDDDDYATGQLELEVAAPQVAAFGNDLDKLAQALGGKQISSAVSGEDLSKQIIDTDARLRARLLLRDRLMNLLATHRGSVAELIEAERGVADVNQEIDEAQSLLKDLNGRIEFSHVIINYDSDTRSGSGFFFPISTTLRSLGTILGWVIAGLIALTVALVPITAFVLAWRWAWRKARGLLQSRLIKPADSAPTGSDSQG